MVTSPRSQSKMPSSGRGSKLWAAGPQQGRGVVVLDAVPWAVLWTWHALQTQEHPQRDSSGPKQGCANRGLSIQESLSGQKTPIPRAPQVRIWALHTVAGPCERRPWPQVTRPGVTSLSPSSPLFLHEGLSNNKRTNTKESTNQKLPIAPGPPGTREGKRIEFCYVLGKGTANLCVCMCITL